MKKKFDAVLNHYREICSTLSQQIPNSQTYIRLSKKCMALQPIIESIEELYAARRSFQDLVELYSDPELLPLVHEEKEELIHKIESLEQHINLLLLPQDTDEEKNVILEIRAGSGGLEAALFASELFEMYRRYSSLKKWVFETISITQTDIGGFQRGYCCDKR